MCLGFFQCCNLAVSKAISITNTENITLEYYVLCSQSSFLLINQKRVKFGDLTNDRISKGPSYYNAFIKKFARLAALLRVPGLECFT